MTEPGAQHFIVIASCVANVALAFVAISGNALVLYGVWKTPALCSPSILLICGLASTDLCVGLIAQPVIIVTSFVKLYSHSDNLKSILTKATFTIPWSLCGVSLFIIAGISIDRLIAIVKPLQYPSIVTSSRVARILVVIWAVCEFVVSTQFWDRRIFFAIVSTNIFICLILSIVCHATIYKIMRRHRLQIHSQIQAFEDSNTRTGMASLRKSAFNAFVVFIVLVICYFLYLVLSTIDIIDNVGDLTLRSLLSSTALFLNSALNPLLYCWRIREIRVALLQTFHRFVSREP